MIVYIFMGRALKDANDFVPALQNYRRALEIHEKLNFKTSRNDKDLADIYAGLGEVMSKTNDLRGAIQNLERAVKLQTELLAKDPANFVLKRDLTSAGLLLETTHQKTSSLKAFYEKTKADR
jgi:tetratricopeptide (TPR) repeat protein